jgi:hypothetical protein
MNDLTRTVILTLTVEDFEEQLEVNGVDIHSLTAESIACVPRVNRAVEHATTTEGGE